MYRNAGEIQNRGIELLNAEIARKKTSLEC
jgi:hypothetical protein